MVRLYTRGGDKGETTCFALGRRIPKDHPLLEALGSLDELNSNLGLARSMIPEEMEEARDDIAWMQRLLFRVGFTVSGNPSISEDDVKKLEEIADKYMEGVELKFFILPGGPVYAAQLHVARTVARRAERRFIAALREVEIENSDLIMKVMNRISDSIFAMAVGLAVKSGYSLEPATG